jgi:hypothetical protein
MPARILVDSVFVIALINRRDQYHALAAELAAQLEGQPLLITDAVLLELGNALARQFRGQAVAVIERFLDADEVEVVHITPHLFAQAFGMFKKHTDKEWSLVDCISFVAMQEAGVDEALTFDRHFVQAGFRALMRETQGSQ